MRRIIFIVALALAPATASGAEPPDLAERVREIHKQVVAAQALAESPLDEKGRRSLVRRLGRIDEALSELELALRGAPVPPPAPPPVVVAPPPQPPPAPTATPMTPAEHNQLLERLKAASFASDRTYELEEGLRGRTVTAAQAARILAAFSFSSERLDAARAVVAALSDPDNGRLLVDAMDFAGDKDAVRDLLRDARSQ